MAICSRFVSNFRDGSSQYSTRGVPETATRRYHLRTGVAPFDARTAVRGRPRVLVGVRAVSFGWQRSSATATWNRLLVFESLLASVCVA